MTRPTISLACIMKNEAHNLSPMLQSVRGCFDEIVIVDTGSTDGSVAFVEKINTLIEQGDTEWSGIPKIKIGHFDWVNDFSKARNYSFSLCTSDYIFWQDLDDSLANKDAFIRWRDTVMHSAHYWVALYNYSIKDGQPECQFIRERVIKRGHGFAWEYFVHEGIIQKEDRKFWPQRANSWWVDHRRTDEDRKADHMRNLKLYEGQDIEGVHPRMKFYLGKEYCENGMPEKAAKPLHEAIKSGRLDPHDLILSIQYCAQSAFATKHYPQAMHLLHKGLELQPQRAEFWCLLGDSYCNIGDMANAIHCFRVAMNCEPNDMGGLVVVYGHAYKEYPRIKLSDVYLGAGDWVKAEPYVQWLVDNNQPMAKEFVARLAHVKNLSIIRTDLPKTDDIIITCPPGGVTSNWDENSLEVTGHGGSETACIEVARWLKKKTNRRVKVFQQRDQRATMPSGVEYHPVSDLSGYLHNVEPFAHIGWRHAVKVTNAKSYVWCHDLQCPGGHLTGNYDKMIALSGFHKNYLIETNGVPEDKIALGFNGINPKDFAPRGTIAKDPLKVVFSSSPDRGLVQCIDIVKKAREISGLDIKLHTFYGFANMRKMGAGAWADQIEAKIKENTFTIMHGQVDKKTLMSHFADAAVWLYPADFIESACITAHEAMCSGTWPIVRDMGALKYTMKDAIAKGCVDITDVEVKDEASIGLWANLLVESIRDRKWEKMDFDPENYSWERVADFFIELLGVNGDAKRCGLRSVLSA